LSIAAAGILSNDTDPDTGDTLTVSAVNGSAAAVGSVVLTDRGTVRVNADGSFVYTPAAANEDTSDSFTYTTNDGHGGTALAVVTIAITRFTGVSTVAGVMRVSGGAGADFVTAGCGTLWVNGTPYSLSGVTEVRVWGRGGDDRIDLSGLSLRTFVSGGAGNDMLTGGAGGDVLLGGVGDDYLVGGSGADVLDGGTGADRLVGGSGADVLIGGTFSSLMDLVAIRAMGTAWVASHDATNEDVATIVDDPLADGADRFTGSAGSDWFIISVGDTVTDAHTNWGHDGDVITYVD
jgi:VCBS repeat-containing protein